MPEVDIKVAGRTYRIGCGEGEEDRARELGARVDAEATQLASQMGTVSEGRLMLLAALMLADKLADSEEALNAAQADAAPDVPEPAIDSEREAQIAANLDALSARIETLVGRVQGNA